MELISKHLSIDIYRSFGELPYILPCGVSNQPDW